MPRLSEAKKDVISCEKLRGLAHTNWSVDIRMGQPNPGNAGLSTTESIGCEKLTQGTETSKYLEENKTIVISWVVASERETA